MEIVESIQQTLKAGREAREKAAVAPKDAVTFKATSVDEFGIIHGIGGAAGSPSKLDRDAEFLEKGDLCKMAFDFCAGARSFNANHGASLDCQLVESFLGAPIIKDGEVERTLKADEVFDPSKYVGKVDRTKGNESHWFVSVRPSDPKMVELAKAGGISGFSWGARVSKNEV